MDNADQTSSSPGTLPAEETNPSHQLPPQSQAESLNEDHRPIDENLLEQSSNSVEMEENLPTESNPESNIANGVDEITHADVDPMETSKESNTVGGIEEILTESKSPTPQSSPFPVVPDSTSPEKKLDNSLNPEKEEDKRMEHEVGNVPENEADSQLTEQVSAIQLIEPAPQLNEVDSEEIQNPAQSVEVSSNNELEVAMEQSLSSSVDNEESLLASSESAEAPPAAASQVDQQTTVDHVEEQPVEVAQGNQPCTINEGQETSTGIPNTQQESKHEEPEISREVGTYLEKADELMDRLEKEVVESHNTPSSPQAPVVDVVFDCGLASSGSPPLSSSASTARAVVADEEPRHLLHHIKTIHFKDKKVGIVTQNENGPCPLVAIINVLLLRRQISLPSSAEIVTAAKLMEHIGDAMLECVPKNLSGEARLNYEQNMMDAMAVLPRLQTGLDVNVKFTGVRDFEYTPECIIFDLLRVPLFHGWLVDPQEEEVVSAIGQAGYNQLVEKVISQKNSIDADAATQALIIETFLERSASQLTYHGLSELSGSLSEDEIGVLFRNNHFSTIYKHQNELFQLVTDQGFLGEANVVWETLSSIDGDGQFVDCHFRNVPPKPSPKQERASSASGSANTSGHNTSALSTSMTAEQQIDHDFLVALSLQEEQTQQQQHPGSQDVQPPCDNAAVAMSEEDKNAQEQLDLALARQLQEEEERHAAEAEAVEREAASATAATVDAPPEHQQQGSRPSPSGQSKNKCTFL